MRKTIVAAPASWWLACCLLAVLNLVSCPLALAAPTEATDAADRARLLQGVSEIIAPGGIVGDFVVFGPNAFAVVTGLNGKARLPIVAGAHYGRGRAVTLGHEAFVGGAGLQNADDARFAANIAQWLGGKPLAQTRIGLCGQTDELRDALRAAGCRVTQVKAGGLPASLADLDALWLDQAGLDGMENRARVEAVRQWVGRGGGVCVAGPAWGWRSLHPSLDLATDHSGNRLVMPMGLAFADGEAEPTGKRGFLTPQNPDASSFALTGAEQAVEALQAFADGKRTLTGGEREQITATLTGAVGALARIQPAFVQRVQALCAAQGGDIAPTKQTPIRSADLFARLNATLDAQKWQHSKPEDITASPAAASFPGDVPAEAKRLTQTSMIDTQVPEWHGVGLYAAPGDVITITLPASAAGKGLAVRIGAHTDRLWHLDHWERFPDISLSRPLQTVTTRVASPFGGTIYIEVPDRCTLGIVPVTVANAVAAPRYVRGVTSVEAWKRDIRAAPGPWAELEGKLVILTVPASAVRDLDDPQALMAYWDDVMEHCYAFYAAPKRRRAERYCVDRQISAGYMHSGYPIMTGEDVARTFCDVSILRGASGIKCWGFYHEMGHNFQQPEWTWQAFGEVTNNLFSLYGAEALNGVKVGAHPAMTQAEIAKRVQTVANAPGREAYYARDPWYPLTMFWLLRQEFGWEPFTRLFAEFRDLPPAARPRSEREKHDQFVTRFSRLTGRNLAPYLTAWGVEMSDAARAQTANLPAWMPAGWPQK